MKSIISIAFVFFSAAVNAQLLSDASYQGTTQSNGIYTSENFLSTNFSAGLLFERGEDLYLTESEHLVFSSAIRPLAPILTTNGADLEICNGNSTRLTANSSHIIYWYTVPPPIGIPVGTGSSFITPALSTGYYTYYAVAENNGIKSEVTAMEVVMVYPSPTLVIESSASRLCANETATLSVSGTTYYEWENGPVSAQITIRPTNTQTYKVTGINTAGCKSTVEYTQEVDICNTGEGEDAVNNKRSAFVTASVREEKLTVFPNPNNGVFTVETSAVSENTKAEIYNWLGELVYSFKVDAESSTVELTSSPNGIYVVRIFENSKLLKQQKIVKE